MRKPPIKYNPAFLTEDELIDSFVVRHLDLNLILQVIRENTSESNQHVLVVGPRGSGKTTLAYRVASEVRKDEPLGRLWYPVIFSEESYEICSAAEFWLEALLQIGHQTEDKRWYKAYEDIGTESDTTRLRDRALAQLTDLSIGLGKRLLLIVENLNTILGEQVSEDDAWAIRHTLMHESRVMLMATATSRVGISENSGKAMFDLFKVHELQPLDENECRAVWASVTGRDIGPQRIQPIKILTGGSPRLLTIISHFGASLSFRQLMEDMSYLVDEHTEYFKSHLESLPPIERKAYVALATLWDPSTAREVAEVARLQVSKTSSLLGRLIERGAVVESKSKVRTKRYQLAERLYNIYYLMRRRGAPSDRVRAIVQFMVSFYDDEGIAAVASSIAEEACRLDSNERQDHYAALDCILPTLPADTRVHVVECAPAGYPEEKDDRLYHGAGAVEQDSIVGLDAFPFPYEVPEHLSPEQCGLNMHDNQEIRGLMGRAASAIRENPQQFGKVEQLIREALQLDNRYTDAWIQLGIALAHQDGRLAESEEALRRATAESPDRSCAWSFLARLLSTNEERKEEAVKAANRAIEINPKCVHAWFTLAGVRLTVEKNFEEAAAAYERVTELSPEYSDAWLHLGDLYATQLQRYSEAEQAYRRVIEKDPNSTLAWAHLGRILHLYLQRAEEAEAAILKALEIDPGESVGWAELGDLYHLSLGRFEEAEQAYMKLLDKEPGSSWAWEQLGVLLHRHTARYEDAEEAYRKSIELYPTNSFVWRQLSLLLHRHTKRYEEAEEACRKSIELDPDNSFAWVNLGELLCEHSNRFDEAEKCLRKGLQLNPNSHSAWEHLGWLLATHLHRYDEAEAAYKASIEQDSTCPRVWVYRGQLSAKLRRYDEAEKYYRKAIEIQPKWAPGWIRLGSLLRTHLQREEEAETALLRAVEIEPDDPNTWTALADLYQFNLNRHEEAAQSYRKALRINPDDIIALARLGRVLNMHLEKPDEAETVIRKSVEVKPDHPLGWAELGDLCHFNLNNFEEAEDAYRKALKLDPELHWVWEHLGRLLSLKLQRHDEAREAYDRAIEHEPNCPLIWRHYCSLLLSKLHKPEEARLKAREGIALDPEDSERLNNLAWTFFLEGPDEYLGEAENWIRRALEIDDSTEAEHTLACILARRHKAKDALSTTAKILNDEDFVAQQTDALVQLFAELVGANLTKQALRALQESKGASMLEPLKVALRYLLEEEVDVAAEINEVALDVRNKIEDLIVSRREATAQNERSSHDADST